MECMGEGVITEAMRIVEGVEADHYVCLLGHLFGMTWRAPAEISMWPPPPELVEAIKKDL